MSRQPLSCCSHAPRTSDGLKLVRPSPIRWVATDDHLADAVRIQVPV